MKKILFISHDDSLSGAPILLKNLIDLINEEKKYSIKIVIKNKVGYLSEEFSKRGDTLIWKQNNKLSFLDRILKKVFKFTKQYYKNQNKIQHWIDESDVLISNTITNGDFFKSFDFSKVNKVISYIHELEYVTSIFSNSQDFKYLFSVNMNFMVPSKAVALHLINNLNIQASKISYLNYYIPSKVKVVKPINNLNADFFIGMVGTLEWRKGIDLLPIIVAHFFKIHPLSNVKFMWKGASKKGIEYEKVLFELKKIDKIDKVIFEFPSMEMETFYNTIDVLLMCSKEDPYPLVVLEAAGYRKPTICFSGAGGAPEFVQEDAGATVPYLDIESLVDRLYEFSIDNEKCIMKGLVAYNRYTALHLSKSLIKQQFEKNITV